MIPAPLAAALSAAPEASVRFRSSTVNVVEFIVVEVPSTWRFPFNSTSPVLSPTVAGSIVSVAPLRISGVVIDPVKVGDAYGDFRST